MLLGFDPRDDQFIVNFYHRGLRQYEQLVFGKIYPDTLRVVFVPAAKVKYVTDLLRPAHPNLNVYPIEPAIEALPPFGNPTNDNRLFSA